MLMYIYTIRDSAAALYGRPFYVQGPAVAVRSFTDEVNKAEPQNDLFNHPEDFELFELGTYNDATAVFELYSQPKPLCTAKQVFKKIS